MKIIFFGKRKLIICIITALIILTALFCAFSKDGSCTLTVTDALDTVSNITVYGGIGKRKAADKCAELIRKYDRRLSVNNPESEIYGFNHSDGGSEFSEEVYNLIKACGEIYHDTDCRFDITIGAVSRLWSGAFLSQRLPESGAISKASAFTDYSALTFDDNSRTITKKAREQELNLGAVAKGFIADRISEYLDSTDVSGALIDLGGNIYVCGKNGKKGNWHIGIQDPNDSSSLIGLVEIDSGFVITSGDYQRYLISDGVRYHHILNAKTGFPSESGLRSVTVISDNGFIGDALSTACFVSGLDNGIRLAKKYNVKAIFVTDDNKVYYSDELDGNLTERNGNYSYSAF